MQELFNLPMNNRIDNICDILLVLTNTPKGVMKVEDGKNDRLNHI